jgi:hypothetical protein
MTLLRGAVFGDFDYETVGDSSIGIILYLFMKLFFSTLLLVSHNFNILIHFQDYFYCCYK